MNKKLQINPDDLSPEAREQLGLNEPDDGRRPRRVSYKLVTLGQILLDLKGMTTRDALWCLTEDGNMIRSLRDAEISGESRQRLKKNDKGANQ